MSCQRVGRLFKSWTDAMLPSSRLIVRIYAVYLLEDEDHAAFSEVHVVVNSRAYCSLLAIQTHVSQLHAKRFRNYGLATFGT